MPEPIDDLPPPRELASRLLARQLWWTAALAYLGAGLAGRLTFSVWDQILYHARVAPWELDFARDAHAFRYLLMLPVLTLSDALNVDLDTLFTLEVCSMMIGVSIVLDKARALTRSDPSPWAWSRVAYLLFFIGLSLFMNGRMVFGFLGISLVMYAQAAWQAKRISLGRMGAIFCLSLFLGSISTGVFTVTLGAIVAWAAVVAARDRGKGRRRSLAVALACVFLLILNFPFLAAYVRKNLEFHETFVGMLSHGPGEYIVAATERGGWVLSVLIALASLSTGLTLLLLMRRHAELRPVLSVLACTASGGLFGYSTFNMGIPAFLILLTPVFRRRPRPEAFVGPREAEAQVRP